jgi:hypothetical protein
VPVDDLPVAPFEAEHHRDPQLLVVQLRVPGVEHVGALDRDRVRDPALHVLDQVFEVNFGAAREERAGGEQVALVHLGDTGFSETAEPTEDRRRFVLGCDRQPRRRVSVDEGRVRRLVARQELV